MCGEIHAMKFMQCSSPNYSWKLNLKLEAFKSFLKFLDLTVFRMDTWQASQRGPGSEKTHTPLRTCPNAE